MHPHSFVNQLTHFKPEDKRLAFVTNGLAITVMALMALHEIRDLFKDRPSHHR